MTKRGKEMPKITILCQRFKFSNCENFSELLSKVQAAYGGAMVNVSEMNEMINGVMSVKIRSPGLTPEFEKDVHQRAMLPPFNMRESYEQWVRSKVRV